jgi:hypothetical protein
MKGYKYMSEENSNLIADTLEASPAEEAIDNDVIEVEWEKLEEVFNVRSMLRQAEDYLGKMMVDFEKRKKSLLLQTAQLEEKLYLSASTIKEELNITSEHTYELKLPHAPGEKGYFIRKEA